MSSTMTTRRIPTPRLGGTIARLAPVAIVLIIALGVGIALVQPEPTSAGSTQTRSAVVDNSLTSPCRHQMTASPQALDCGAVPAAGAATEDYLGRPHGYVHRQRSGNCVVVPKRGWICEGELELGMVR
jgi:hypothetical protein